MPGFLSVLRPRLARDRYDILSAVLIVGLVALALATFGDYAISNDEEVQQRYGELILAYYGSGFADQSVFGYKNLYLYGGLFDIVSTMIGRATSFDLYEIRHVLSAITGIGGIVATIATARLIAGARAGFIAGVALTLCGVWYGGMFNHTKDVPFAAAMMGTVYFLLRAARSLPRPSWGDTLGFGLLLGAGLGLRAMGLLLPFYLGVVVLWQAFRHSEEWRERARFIRQTTVRFLPAMALAYVIMIASWPWASLALFNPVKAVWAFAHFHYEIRTMLAGKVYLMDQVPRWYIPTYLAIKLPLILFAGVALALAAAVWPRPAGECARMRREIALVAVVAAFPVLCVVALHGPAFTGMRHVMYVVPPLTVLAGIGFDRGLAALERLGPLALGSSFAALAAGFVWQAAQLVALHPHQHLFFNSLVGGLEGASRRYATDYWVNIMPEAVKGLEAYVGDRRARYTAGVCGERISFEHMGSQFRWTGDWLQADFFIAPTNMNCDRVLRGRTAFTIEREGVVIGVVQDLRGLKPHERGFADFPPGSPPRMAGEP